MHSKSQEKTPAAVQSIQSIQNKSTSCLTWNFTPFWTKKHQKNTGYWGSASASERHPGFLRQSLEAFLKWLVGYKNVDFPMHFWVGSKLPLKKSLKPKGWSFKAKSAPKTGVSQWPRTSDQRPSENSQAFDPLPTSMLGSRRAPAKHQHLVLHKTNPSKP